MIHALLSIAIGFGTLILTTFLCLVVGAFLGKLLRSGSDKQEDGKQIPTWAVILTLIGLILVSSYLIGDVLMKVK